jgi:hypothetical protein
LRAGADPLVVDVQGLTAAHVSRTRQVTFTIPIWGALVDGRVPRPWPTALSRLLEDASRNRR